MIFQTENLYLSRDSKSWDLGENDLLICGYSIEEIRNIIESNDEYTLKDMARTGLKRSDPFFNFENDNQSYLYAYLLEKNPDDDDDSDEDGDGYEYDSVEDEDDYVDEEFDDDRIREEYLENINKKNKRLLEDYDD